jgi:hypothetical protein
MTISFLNHSNVYAAAVGGFDVEAGSGQARPQRETGA